ncbi:MAG: DUF4112 domain-containing protein [Nitrococcus sp.]|nr:DUF4112 domain-containing protein [Nitrococcus sp.]
MQSGSLPSGERIEGIDEGVSAADVTPEALRRLRRLRRMARLLDSRFQIPGTRWRFGLDAVIGLVPGVGDTVSAALSLWIIAEARRLGVPSGILRKMLLNLGVDAVAGSVPILGDAFDAGFKANLRNLALLEQALFKRGQRDL